MSLSPFRMIGCWKVEVSIQLKVIEKKMYLRDRKETVNSPRWSWSKTKGEKGKMVRRT